MKQYIKVKYYRCFSKIDYKQGIEIFRRISKKNLNFMIELEEENRC